MLFYIISYYRLSILYQGTNLYLWSSLIHIVDNLTPWIHMVQSNLGSSP